MLGYALFGLLYGASQTHVFAMADIGQTVFAYTVFMSTLEVVNGQKPSVRAAAKNMLTNPASVGMLLGIALGLLGVGKGLRASGIGPLVGSLISFLTAPTAVLILLMVGYELSFNRAIMKPVMLTALLRLLVMGALCAVCALGGFCHYAIRQAAAGRADAGLYAARAVHYPAVRGCDRPRRVHLHHAVGFHAALCRGVCRYRSVYAGIVRFFLLT